ncbi:substrate-binding domain-containing protein [Pseudonocardia sp. NPDC046786]|uniref:substrate-binding domain-containing protein n=1 Tax=Pseudonocardia sp. NPDC046786 TaxID=3155471 RepID=UPI0033FEC62D
MQDQTSRSATDRRDGFTDRMRANAPDVELLEPQYGGGDQARSADITKAILAANPDLAGIYGSDEGSAFGVVRGGPESGRDDLTIIVFDSGAAQMEAIRSGQMPGAVTQDPIATGTEVVKAGVKAARGEVQPPEVDTGFHWYDRTSIDDPEIQAVLYE